MRLNSINICAAAIGCTVASVSATALVPARCPATYLYTGAVTSVSGIYASIPIGAQVTGTYTFDSRVPHANSNPNVGFGGLVSNGAQWQVGTSGLSTGYAFSSTAQVAGFSFGSSTPDPFEQYLYSVYSNNIVFFDNFFATEFQSDRNGLYTSSSIVGITPPPGETAFGKHGMPKLLPGSSYAVGNFGIQLPGEQFESLVVFNIESLVMVSASTNCEFGLNHGAP